MKVDTYREHLNDLQAEIEGLRAQLKEAQTGDTISRQAALDALMEAFCDTMIERICKDTIEALPPAQPEVRTEMSSADDTISRQAAIDVLCRALHHNYEEGYAVTQMYSLPSAQPERCEDCVNFNKTRLLIPQPEIIRCKDCKWFGDIGCAIRIVDDSDKPTENDFCSFAERRSDE